MSAGPLSDEVLLTQFVSKLEQNPGGTTLLKEEVRRRSQSSHNTVGVLGGLGVQSVPDFSIVTAIGCARLTFDSYHQAPRAKDAAAAQHLDPFDCTVYYSCPHLFASHFDAVLSVGVESAANLKRSDMFRSTNNAYVKLSVEGSRNRTSVAERSETPTWKEGVSLFVKDAAVALKLRVEVWDDDRATSDDLLGVAEVDLSELSPSSRVSFKDIPLLQPNGSPEGSISLTVKLLPVDETTALAALEEAYVWPGSAGNVEIQEPREKATDGGGDVSTPSLDAVARHERECDAADSELVNEWREMIRTVGLTVFGPFAPCAFVECKPSATQLWIYRNRDTKSVVLAYPGSSSPMDGVRNLNVVPADYNGSLPNMPEGLKLHAGFQSAYKSVHETLMREVTAIISEGDPAEWKVFIGGHSLGGAIAAINAFEMSALPIEKNACVCYTLGSPRVGNGVFAKAFAEAVPNSFRIEAEWDLITKVPLVLGWRHVPHRVHVSRTGEVDLDAEDEEEISTESKNILSKLLGSVDNHTVEQYGTALQNVLALEMCTDHPSA